jgi:DNA-binding LacI/PurR family transcriptional regulator
MLGMSPDRPVQEKSLTWKEVALAAGVSPTTASLAMNNHPRVAERTRRRVAEAAAKLGFVNNRAARRLARSRASSRTPACFEQIGLMYVTTSQFGIDPALVAMMHGAERELAIADACLLFVHVDHKEGMERAQRLVRSGLIDGWLISGAVGDELISKLQQIGVPHVIIGDHLCTRPIHAVNVDYFGASRIATLHLAQLGHRRIGFLGGKLEFAYQTQSLDGYRAGLKASGIEPDDRLVIRRKTLKEWMLDFSKDERPTALVCGEPNAEPMLRQVMNELGLEVPRDMSLITSELGAQKRTLELTRLELPLDEVGRHGAILLQRVVQEPRLASSDMKLAATFVDRGSTGPLGG